MLAKKDALVPVGKKYDEPLDKLALNLDTLTFSRIQSLDILRLRVFCPDNNASLNFILKNMNSKNGKGEIGMTIDAHLNSETFLNIINPKLKVIFQNENRVALFTTHSVTRGAVFSAQMPMTDMIN